MFGFQTWSAFSYCFIVSCAFFLYTIVFNIHSHSMDCEVGILVKSANFISTWLYNYRQSTHTMEFYASGSELGKKKMTLHTGRRSVFKGKGSFIQFIALQLCLAVIIEANHTLGRRKIKNYFLWLNKEVKTPEK